MQTPKTDAEKRDKLRSIINGIRTGFMVTKGPDGQMHGRPMATAEVEPNFTTVWFATQRDSEKVHEIAHDSHVYLGYSNASGSGWASINGIARVVEDKDKAAQLWNPFWKNWFEGPHDPKLVLIEVTPQGAEYWDEGSRIVQLLKFAWTAVTGKHVNEGEHGRVEMMHH
jgi:general stress protein 26